MRITDVRCVRYTGELHHPEPFWPERLRRPTDAYPEFAATGPVDLPRTGPGRYRVESIFLHIDTDEGVTGSTAHISADQAHIINATLRRLLLGADPLATERIWDIGRRSSIHARRGAGMLALSAVDCALWDIRGRRFGVPCHVLLGGPTRQRVPVYVSTLGTPLDHDTVRRVTREVVDSGAKGVKWFPRWGPPDGQAGVRAVAELVETVRAEAGDDLEIMLDAWSSWDVEFTVNVARACRDLRLRWIEEPLDTDDIGGYRRVRDLLGRTGSTVAVAGGEHEYGRWGFAGLVADGVFDVCQPDPHWAGGISEVTKIGAILGAAGVPMVPHGQSLQCNAALAFATSPHLTPEMEYLAKLGPLYQHFLAEPIAPSGGMIDVPSQPGLGMELDQDRIVDAEPLP
ncbi:L-alanine-DL-glutamate epimerase-like enolase superfamily enzyme [Haloactinopolyspora alba]|uniref:L-alanine-DL-glutamate epimerase-like enolase superfamily enzyme n=1 Tax=Haloactinopolyspora alba TaxID=648780 RepID=A0A2P8DVP7_9ACTN|nr:enolase C-terminal domain-like protein [Haloactinopolyspora alba]PSL01286.1 L-alanine-DL-glutamate epimerase-like enolase superfamily enzyme [Haloactinopolyspora alba]